MLTLLLKRFLTCIPFVFPMAAVMATDVSYPDQSATSPSGRYQVEAKSPDNRFRSDEKAFQSNFHYKLRDRQTKRVIWKRKQGKDEDSCESLFINDEGIVVILTSGNELTVVNLAGEQSGKIDLLSKVFSRRERKRYVVESTAGPRWQYCSLWYFVSRQNVQLFVIRTWWDRRVIVDLQKGAVVSPNRKILAACHQAEKERVLADLKTGIQTHTQWEKDDGLPKPRPPLTPAYQAGKLGFKEAIPLLRQLEISNYYGSIANSFSQEFDGEVDPGDYKTFTLRQIVQLSLRRLGATPRNLPVTGFYVSYKDYRKNHPLKTGPLVQPKTTCIPKLKQGMTPERAISLIGTPDVVRSEGNWEYDLKHSTLILSWDGRHIKGIREKHPPNWQVGNMRDLDLFH